MPLKMLTKRQHVREAVCEPAMVEVCGAEGSSVYGAAIVNISRSGLRISMPRAVEPGMILKIHRGDPAMICTGTVRYCRADSREDTFYIGLELAVPLERRKEPRYRVRERAFVTVLKDGKANGRLSAQLRDISKSGFSLEINEWVAVGAQVLVFLPSYGLLGTVRNVREAEGGYIIGLETADVIEQPVGTREGHRVSLSA